MKSFRKCVATGVAAVLGFGTLQSIGFAADAGDKPSLVTVRRAGEKPLEYLVRKQGGNQEAYLVGGNPGGGKKDEKTIIAVLHIRKAGGEQQDLLMKGRAGGKGVGGKKK